MIRRSFLGTLAAAALAPLAALVSKRQSAAGGVGGTKPTAVAHIPQKGDPHPWHIDQIDLGPGERLSAKVPKGPGTITNIFAHEKSIIDYSGTDVISVTQLSITNDWRARHLIA